MTNPLDLPFDADEMLAGLKPWIETESPTFDTAAVNRMMDVVQHDLAAEQPVDARGVREHERHAQARDDEHDGQRPR